jgi:hypothetical protein
MRMVSLQVESAPKESEEGSDVRPWRGDESSTGETKSLRQGEKCRHCRSSNASLPEIEREQGLYIQLGMDGDRAMKAE